jgi:hypothetical protein
MKSNSYARWTTFRDLPTHDTHALCYMYTFRRTTSCLILGDDTDWGVSITLLIFIRLFVGHLSINFITRVFLRRLLSDKIFL